MADTIDVDGRVVVWWYQLGRSDGSSASLQQRHIHLHVGRTWWQKLRFARYSSKYLLDFSRVQVESVVGLNETCKKNKLNFEFNSYKQKN